MYIKNRRFRPYFAYRVATTTGYYYYNIRNRKCIEEEKKLYNKNK